MNEQLMFNRVRELCIAVGIAIDTIGKDCNIRQDLVAKLFIENMKAILDDVKKKDDIQVYSDVK